MKSMDTTPVSALSRKAYRLAESSDAEPGELIRLVLRLHGRGEGGFDHRRPAGEREKYRLEAARAGIERRAELPASEEANPFDDQDKLDEVRRAVFGSAPE